MANEKTTIQELADRFAERNHCSRSVAEMFLKRVFEQIKQGLKDDSFVKIKGLGTFKLVTVGSRASVDVNTGERIEISEHQRLVFTPDNSIKQRVNRPFEQFETVILDDDSDITGLDEVDDKNADTFDEVDEELSLETPTKQVENNESSDEIIEPTPEVIVPSEQHSQEDIPNVPADYQSVYIGEQQKDTNQEESDDLSATSEEEATAIPASSTTDTPVTESEEPTPPTDTVDSESEHDDDDTEEEEDIPSRHTGYVLTILIILLVIGMVVGSYFVGYYRLLSPNGFSYQESATIDSVKQEVSVTNHDTLAVELKNPTDSVKKDSMVTNRPINEESNKSSFEEKAKQYEQLPGGDYYIVGTLTTHTMKPGDTLLRLARKHYGKISFTQYIIFYNKISNPDVIPLGMTLELPRLVDKSYQEITNIP